MFHAVSAPDRSKAVHESPRWPSPGDTDTESVQLDAEAAPTLTSTPLKPGYVRWIQNVPSQMEYKPFYKSSRCV